MNGRFQFNIHDRDNYIVYMLAILMKIIQQRTPTTDIMALKYYNCVAAVQNAA